MQRRAGPAILYLGVLAVCAAIGWQAGVRDMAHGPWRSLRGPAQSTSQQAAAPRLVPVHRAAASDAASRAGPGRGGARSQAREAISQLAARGRTPVDPNAGPASAPALATEPALVGVEPAAEPPPAAVPAVQTADSAPHGGVLIVISLASQRAFVFRNGELWDSSRVSTGKPGKRTPAGTFTILEKQVHHRSTKYDDAPMPYMQRLTWGGVALHAGHVPAYAASHGCIRLPFAFAKRLYRITDFQSTVVVVTEKRVASADEARKFS